MYAAHFLGDAFLQPVFDLVQIVCRDPQIVGDGFGALIGKPFGKHKITLKCADNRKSVEGSAAMFITSAIAVFAVMTARGGMGTAGCIIVAAAASAVATFVEMCTKNGNDTITCPVAAMAVVLPLTYLLGG